MPGGGGGMPGGGAGMPGGGGGKDGLLIVLSNEVDDGFSKERTSTTKSCSVILCDMHYKLRSHTALSLTRLSRSLTLPTVLTRNTCPGLPQ